MELDTLGFEAFDIYVITAKRIENKNNKNFMRKCEITFEKKNLCKNLMVGSSIPENTTCNARYPTSLQLSGEKISVLQNLSKNMRPHFTITRNINFKNCSVFGLEFMNKTTCTNCPAYMINSGKVCFC